MIKDCLTTKKKNERTKFKSNIIEKRAMVAIGNDSDSFISESEDEEIANLYLVARESSRENDESEDLT